MIFFVLKKALKIYVYLYSCIYVSGNCIQEYPPKLLINHCFGERNLEDWEMDKLCHFSLLSAVLFGIFFLFT